MRKIRVLIVDDAAVVRRTLADLLSADPSIAVVGTAAGGAAALGAVSRLAPDLVVLDIDMPDPDGVSVLAELRRAHGSLPVILLSPLTERAAAATLRALTLGAADYVTRPLLTRDMGAAMQLVAAQLVPKIRGLGWPEPLRPAGCAAPAPPPPRSQPIDIVAVGASTGGPNALTALFADLPASLPVPVVIVQHMPPVFTRMLADRLAASCPLSFCEAQGGDRLEPGRVWIAPGDRHMRLRRDAGGVHVVVDDGPPENSCRPAVDVLFRSVAEAYGAACLAVVLTGGGQDGLRGCEAVRRGGGQVMVQDQATSAVGGMPGAVADAGLADCVLPLSQIAGEVLRRLAHRRGDG